MVLISEKGNIVLKLVQDFGRSQNVISITACLTTPTFAENSVQWGTSVNNFIKIWEHMCSLKKRISFQPISVT